MEWFSAYIIWVPQLETLTHYLGEYRHLYFNNSPSSSPATKHIHTVLKSPNLKNPGLVSGNDDRFLKVERNKENVS
jgi:hypothetical protein